jgi:hypothetical protein
VAVPPSVPLDHPARDILAEFGGIVVGSCGAGEECATSDLAFNAIDQSDHLIEVWSSLLDTKLVGIAEYHHAHGELYVDDSGRCFGRSCVHDAFYYVGASFAEAVERLLLGRRSRPMLRPDQQSVRLYGVEYAADDPTLFRYK